MNKTTSSLSVFGGVSRESSATARQLLDTTVKGMSVEQVIKLAGELFGVVSILDSSTPLRRALTDSSRDAADKAELVSNLLGKSTSSEGVRLIAELAKLRWSNPSNLGDIVEQLAIEAEASAANLAQELDRLEQELFDFSRIVISDGELRQALSSTKYTSEGKRVLVAKLLGGKVSASTSRVFGHLVSGLRGRNIEGTIAFYASATAARRERVIAHVQVAVALTDEQKEKLSRALTEKIGQPVRLNVEINPTVLGGFTIRFADELIDATIVNRLADAGRALAV
jgi:F-type H+-transporting ATPase subunit delta